jgi:hypothetical protein
MAKIGDDVRVYRGKHKGRTGVVIFATDQEVWIDPHMEHGSEPFKVYPHEIIPPDELPTPGGDDMGKYQHEGQSWTSEHAAAAAIPLTGKARVAVYEFVRWRGDHGATDEEIQDALGMNPSTQRPRRVELVESGHLVKSDRTRLTRARRPAVVWIPGNIDT